MGGGRFPDHLGGAGHILVREPAQAAGKASGGNPASGKPRPELKAARPTTQSTVFQSLKHAHGAGTREVGLVEELGDDAVEPLLTEPAACDGLRLGGLAETEDWGG